MAIKINGNTVIDNFRDFFGRDATFTRDVTIDNNLSVGSTGVDGASVFRLYTANAKLTLGEDSQLSSFIRFRASDGDGFHFTGDDDTPRLTILGTGNVGINDATPSYPLDVNGDGRFQDNLLIDGVMYGKIDEIDVADGGSPYMGPNYPIFRRHPSADYDLRAAGAANSWHTIPNWGIAGTWGDYEQGDWGWNNGRITAPVNGIYNFSVNLGIAGMDEGMTALGIRIYHRKADGTNADGGQICTLKDMNEVYRAPGEYSETHTFTHNINLKMTAGNTALVQVYLNDTGDGTGRAVIDIQNNSYAPEVDPNSGGTYVQCTTWWEGRLITKLP